MLTCRELVLTLASDYLDDQLGWRQRIGVRFHLLMCSHCRRFMRQLTLVRNVLARRAEPLATEAEVAPLARHLHHQFHQRANQSPK